MGVKPGRDVVPGRKMTGVGVEAARADVEGSYGATAQLAKQSAASLAAAQAKLQAEIDDAALTVKDGVTTVPSVTSLTVSGATVSTAGAGLATITLPARRSTLFGDPGPDAPDGVRTIFHTTHTPVDGIAVWVGNPPVRVFTGWTLIGDTVTFGVAPAVGDTVAFDYAYEM